MFPVWRFTTKSIGHAPRANIFAAMVAIIVSAPRTGERPCNRLRWSSAADFTIASNGHFRSSFPQESEYIALGVGVHLKIRFDAHILRLGMLRQHGVRRNLESQKISTPRFRKVRKPLHARPLDQ